MKTTLGVGISVLSALAAQGKDFDRTERNAMLDRLAASPEPKVRRGPMAMCYKMVMPDAEEVRFTCPKCGAVKGMRVGVLRTISVVCATRFRS